MLHDGSRECSPIPRRCGQASQRRWWTTAERGRLLEQNRLCFDLVQQLQAVERAVHAAWTFLIHDHFDVCLDRSVAVAARATREVISRLKAITKSL